MTPLEDLIPVHTGITELREEMDRENDYGLKIQIDGIGGTASNYYENLMDAYNEGVSGSRWETNHNRNIS